MFLSFRFKKTQKQHVNNHLKDRIAKSIVNNTMKIQEQCAVFLQRRSERLSYRVKKTFILIFFILSAGYSIYLIIESLMSAKKPLVIHPIKLSENSAKAGDENIKGDVMVSKKEYEKIHRFKIYMDSLTQNPLGRPLYDSILSGRPGLMDSILIIEELYKANN